jgi:hypothetical protein
MFLRVVIELWNYWGSECVIGEIDGYVRISGQSLFVITEEEPGVRRAGADELALGISRIVE